MNAKLCNPIMIVSCDPIITVLFDVIINGSCDPIITLSCDFIITVSCDPIINGSCDLVGVCCASYGSGLEEMTFLCLTSYYDKPTITAWVSGTGNC